MQRSSDSSVWRSLAVSFGDGLAFGVGVKLSQARDRRNAGLPAASEERLEPPRSTDQKVLEAIVGAVDARLAEHAGQVERRIADLDAKIAVELKNLDDQDLEIAHKVTEDLNTLEGQMISLNREFSQAVAKIVAEQVSTQVSAQVGPAVKQLRDEMAARDRAPEIAALRQQMAEIEQRAAAMQSAQAWKDVELEELRKRVAQIDTEIANALSAQVDRITAAKDEEIADLRRRVADAENSVLEIVSGIGQICRQAASRISTAAPPSSPAPTPVAISEPLPPAAPEPEETHASEAPESEPPIPGFAQAQQPARLWRVPLVSSLVAVATGGLILLRYVA